MKPLPTVIGLEAWGARIGIRTAESIAGRLSFRPPPGARTTSSTTFDTTYVVRDTSAHSDPRSSVGFDVVRDDEAVRRCITLDEVRLTLESDMHFRVALAARGFLFVHAGVVEHEGQAIVIPGRTLYGKSSLVMALVQSGATYYSDEYAVIDGDGLIHPYRKPLSERIEGQIAPREHPPESLSVGREFAARPMGLTVITRYRRGARWDPRRVSRADAMMAMFDNTVVARARPEFALRVLAKAVRSTAALKGDRSEAHEAAAYILDRPLPSDG